MYSSRIPATGEGDLVFFRDATLAYCAARREGVPFHLNAPEEALELARWLGLEFEVGEEGRTLTVPADSSTLPNKPLASFREEGFLGQTLFSALVRSSYGPDEEGYFPTKSELGFYFDEALLLSGSARWDEEYLQECQQFFFEELTPAELLEESLKRLPPEMRERAAPFQNELLGVAFLLGEQSSSLQPLSGFFRALLNSRKEEAFRPVLHSVERWDADSLEGAWKRLDDSTRQNLQNSFLTSHPGGRPPQLLLALGRDLVEWKAGL